MRILARKSGYSIREIYGALELWNTGRNNVILLNLWDMMLIRAEMNIPESNKLALDTFTDYMNLLDYTEKHDNVRKVAIEAGYDPVLLDYLSVDTLQDLEALVLELSRRFGSTIFEVVLRYFYSKVRSNMEKKLIPNIYPLDKRIRDILIAVDKEFYDNKDFQYNYYANKPDTYGAYALESDTFIAFTQEAYLLGDVELYITYLKEYINNVDEAYIRGLFSRSKIPDENDISDIFLRSGSFKQKP